MLLRQHYIRASYSAVIAMMWLGQAPAAEAQATGQILCEVFDNGQPTSGIVVLRQGDQKVHEGSCRKATQLPSGRYQAIVTLDGALDNPTVTRNVTVSAEAPVRLRANFQTGTVQVSIKVQGRRAAGMAVLSRGGRRIGTVGSGVPARLSTGRYDVIVRYRNQERRFSDVEIAAGSRQELQAEF